MRTGTTRSSAGWGIGGITTKVSLIIPARNERYLAQTVDDAFSKAAGDIEVIVILDGPTDHPVPREREGLSFIYYQAARGTRVAINHASSIAKGDYLMRVDAHCSFSEGFDEVLQRECDGDWVVIPRRYTLNPELWERKHNKPIDYFYLSCPWSNPYRFLIQACPWVSRTRERLGGSAVDDTMTFQGSCWFMSAEHFRERIGGAEIAGWGTGCSADWLEIGMKTWLGGGRVVVNKDAWYAHMHKARRPRGYVLYKIDYYPELVYAAHYWAENRWNGRKDGLDFGWLVDKFWPFPMAGAKSTNEKWVWPENWREYYEGRLYYSGEQ